MKIIRSRRTGTGAGWLQPTGMSAAAGPAYASTRTVADPTTSAARRGARDWEITR